MKNYLLPIVILFVITASFCQAQNPILWGMTFSGGTAGNGNIFQLNTGGPTLKSVCTFGGGTLGQDPHSALIKASNGLLYGMTANGGIDDSGMIFSYDISTGTKIDIHDFGGATDGKYPFGSLIQASNSLLYGLTEKGGVYNKGTIFSYDPGTETETVLYDFGNFTDGQYPLGSLIQANDGLLYGLTSSGGINSTGTIFSYSISKNTETDLYDFSSFLSGSGPLGSLIQASDGLLYGMASTGGVYGNLYEGGVIFSYDISNGFYTDLHDFGKTTDGQQPFGSLIQAKDSILYGMTVNGGSNGIYSNGVIFSYDIKTTTETVLHDFGSGTDGFAPFGSLIQASDGLLYGMTEFGGVNDSGMIFSYNTTTSAETDIHDFTGIDGEHPLGDLIEYDTQTGTNQISVNNTQLSIYPNPTTGQFTLKLEDDQTNYSIEIYNVMGEKIYQSVLTHSQNSINLNSQPAGIYFYKLFANGNQIATGRIALVLK